MVSESEESLLGVASKDHAIVGFFFGGSYSGKAPYQRLTAKLGSVE